MSRRTRKIAVFGAAIALCFVFAVVAEACPTCKGSSADTSNGGDLVSGYGWSIVFMMSMPFLILTSLGSYFYYEICKARRQQATDAPLAVEPTSMQGA